MMTGNYLANPAIFLIEVLFGAYLLVVLLRLLLQLTRADFYNPISQFVVRATSPLLRPMRRVIPPVGQLDTSSLVLMWGLKWIQVTLVVAIAGFGFHPIAAFFWAIPELVALVLNFFLYAVLIIVILSWVGPGHYNPAVGLLQRLTDPLMRPAQRLIPPMGGLDLSPMVVMVGIVLLQMLLLPPLKAITGSPL